MEINKPNDILVATLNNPQATTYDLMTLDLNPENTSLYSKDEYKNSEFVQQKFTGEDGKFDNIAFDNFYNMAAYHYYEMSNEEYLKGLDEVQFSPFDVTRPMGGKTFKVDVEYAKEYNPFKELYGRTSLDSVDASPLSLRELAQQGKIFDTNSGKFLEESANERGLLGKLFGDTLVYAQWDEDGEHKDPLTGYMIKHAKGDWKINSDGELYIETLGNREVYGKQVVNPMDILTTDGSIANKFDFFEADNKEANALRTTIRLAAEIAPFLIPGVNTYYTAVRVGLGLAAVMPTLYKSFEGLLLGDNKTGMTDIATAAEGYMSKFGMRSTTDEAQQSMFNYEQVTTMASDIFAQIYEQRAMASLSKIFMKGKNVALDAKRAKLMDEINASVSEGLIKGKIKVGEIDEVYKLAINKIPELESFLKKQSSLSKALSLSYMALTSTSDVYGDAINSGYDRHSAGFAALLTASTQYGLMMNNRLGDWFLDQTTGYTTNINRAMMRKTISEYFEPIKKGFDAYAKSPEIGRGKLAQVAQWFKKKAQDTFFSPTVIGENLFKHSVIEGIEEVSEEVLQDAAKAITDLGSYLGWTQKKGSFNTIDNLFSQQGFERYLATFLGGALGGAMFELHRTKLEPWLTNTPLSESTKQSIYEFVGNGHTQLLIDEINKMRSRLGNRYIAPERVEGQPPSAVSGPGKSEADVIADTAIGMIKEIDGFMNANNLAHSDIDIINKALRDHLIIKDLQAAVGESKLGIEGLIVDDFRKLSSRLKKINDDIRSLGATEETTQKNSEQLGELTSEGNEVRAKLEGILNGEYAEKYYKEALFYLAKDVSRHWITIDRDTYIQGKYQRDYYSLPDEGVGLTKQSAEAEWKEYLNAKDLRRDLEMATNGFFDLLRKMNPSMGEYFTSGYSEERSKTNKNLIDLLQTAALFDTSTPEKKAAAVEHFIDVATRIEEATGNRVLPWDVMKNNFAQNIISADMIKGPNIAPVEEAAYLSEEVEQGVSRLDLSKKLLEAAISTLPAEHLGINFISPYFAESVAFYNKEIQSQMEEIAKGEDWENNPESVKAYNDLKKRMLDVRLKDYTETPDFAKKQTKAANALIRKADTLGLNNEDLPAAKYVKDLEETEELEKILAEYLKTSGKTEEELTPQEIVEIFKDTNIYKAFITTNSLENYQDPKELVLAMTEYSDFLHENRDKFIEYDDLNNSWVDKLANPSDLFKMSNRVIDLIINELKAGNWDKELLLVVEKEVDNILGSINKSFFKDLTIGNSDIFTIIENAENWYNTLNDAISNYDDILGWDVPQGLPSYLNVSTVNQAGIVRAALKEFLDSNLKNELKTVRSAKEVIDNKDKFISNSIYDFLEKFELTLNQGKKRRKRSIFNILKDEELSLFKASDISAYLSEDIRDTDIQQAIDAIELMKSTVYAMSTTEVSLGDPYGFIYSLQQFVKRNSLDSDIGDLITITSDLATLMNNDLDRISTKLKFLKTLARANSSQLFNEQEIIRSKMDKIFTDNWRELLSKNIIYKGKPVVPDLEDILKSSDPTDKKLLEIEQAFYDNVKNYTKEEKKEIIKLLADEFNFVAFVDNSGVIDKDVTEVSGMDFMYYMASIMAVNPKDFTRKLRNVFMGQFNKAPFYTQELATRVAYASITDPELFSELVTHGLEEGNLLTNYITYVLGSAGTGKTSVIFKALVELLQDANPNMSIWFSAPHNDQTAERKSEILSGIDTEGFNINSFNKQDLFKRLGITEIIDKVNMQVAKNGKGEIAKWNQAGFIDFNPSELVFDNLPQDLPNIIFIDEITHFNALELSILNEVVKRVHESSGKVVKIIAAGDTTQKGAIIDGVSYNIERVSGIFTPALFLTIRSANTQKRINNDSLWALVTQAKNIFVDNKDTGKVANLIKGNLIFKYHINPETINGDYIITPEKINTATFSPIINALKADPTKTVGILVKDSTTREQLAGIFDSEGIAKENVKFFTPDNIQGAEANYFVFTTDLVNGARITHRLKELYTYMTRAKEGTVIIKNADIENLDIQNAEMDSYSEPYDPLTPDQISEKKEIRIKRMTELLDPNFDLEDPDFKFGQKITPVIGQNDIGDNINKAPEATEAPPEPERTTRKVEPSPDEFLPDNFTYMFHTFYNDLNVKIAYGEDTVTLTRNDNINSGLNFLFGNQDTISMKLEDFKNIVNNVVSLKYSVLANLNKNKKFLISSDNSTLLKAFGDYKPADVDAQLVIKKTDYMDAYNAPFAKKLDDSSKHIGTYKENGFANLYLKLTHNGNEYYLHLAAAASVDMVKAKFGENSETYNRFVAFMDGDNDELQLDRKVIETFTSTRFVKQKVKFADAEKYTLSDLSTIPGLKFYNLKTGKTSDSPNGMYDLFPIDKAAFDALYGKTRFGEAISQERLDEMFAKYKGKPYVAVTFIDEIGGGDSQVKIIPLYSKTRKFADLVGLAEKARQDILKKVGSNVDATLFSGSQVLDLLINLAVNRPQLFAKLISQDYTKDANGNIFAEYFSNIDQNLKGDIIGHISYEQINTPASPLRKIYTLIDKLIKDGNTDAKVIRKAVLEEIMKPGNIKTWYYKFWNILTLPNKLETALLHPNITGPLADKYKELRDIIYEIHDFWKDSDIYYNVKIQTIAGATMEQKGYSIDRIFAEDKENLYTTFVPEGPRLLIDLSTAFKDQNTSVQKPEKKKKATPKPGTSIPPTQVTNKITPTPNEYVSDLAAKGSALLHGRVNDIVSLLNNDSYPPDKAKLYEDAKAAILNNWDKVHTLLESEVKLGAQTVKFKELDFDEIKTVWDQVNLPTDIKDNLDPNSADEFEFLVVLEMLLGTDPNATSILWSC